MNKTMFKLLASAALLAGAPAAFAQSLTVPAQSGVVNGVGQTFVVNFVSNGTDSMNFFLDAAPANVTFTAVADTLAGLDCSVINATRIACIGVPPSGTFGDGTITTTYTAGATTGPVNLTFSMVACTPANCTTNNGVLTLVAGPSGPALGYAPAAGTAIAVPASIGGTTVTSTINVTQTGGDTGQNTTLACSVSGTGYVATVTGSPFAPGGSGGSVGLACAGTAGAQTLTCTQTRSGTGGGAPIVSTWPLTCTSAPGFASVPPDDGTLTLVGIQGTSATASIAVTNPGTAPLNITGCAVTGAAFSLGTISSPIASGASGSIPVTCAVSPTAGTTLTGTLQCNTNAAAPRDVINYNLSCLSQSASIPTLGLGGKALMVLLMLGFGLVGFQLYRRSA